MKHPKREVCFLGNFVQHTADKENQQSRHMLGERNIKTRQANVCALR